MTLQQMQSALGLPEFPQVCMDLFADVQRQHSQLATLLFDTRRISDILHTNAFLVGYEEQILAAARELQCDEAASLYICLLERTLPLGKVPGLPVRMFRPETVGGRFALLFPYLAHIPQNVAYLRSRGLTDEMISATLYEFENSIEEYAQESGGLPGFSASGFAWLRLIYENRLIRIGRLNFEMCDNFFGLIKVFRNQAGEVRILSHGDRIHRSGRPLGSVLCEDEEAAFDTAVTQTHDAYIGHPLDERGFVSREVVHLLKAQWSLVLEQGDKVLSVHIPSGGPLEKDACEQAYDRAKEVFARCFPEFDYQAFFCVSWMMDRQLEDIAKPGSNIVSFQKKFMPFTRLSQGLGVFLFVFLTPFETDHHDLPEDTSLRRAIKQHYLSGGRIYEDCGIFFQ